MASRSKLYFTLALCFNCFILTFLILDSRSISSLDINLGFLPTSWDDRSAEDLAGGRELREHGVSAFSQPAQKVCNMCTANSTLCRELG
jgi:hypothetical protein